MYLRNLMAAIALVTASLCGCARTPDAPVGRYRGERVPVFGVYHVLPKEIVRGSNYRLAESVPVEEYLYVFTIRSDYGVITARGRHMLGLRLGELKSIEAAEKVSKHSLVVDGILTPLRESGKGLNIIIDEPFESIERAPKGLELMVDQYADPADRRAGPPSRRKLAIGLGCDPETRNPVLKKLLDELALHTLGGSLLTQGVMYFIPVPGLGVFALTAQTKELIINSPPSVINGGIDRELNAAGVEDSARLEFRYSAAFTTAQRLQLMEQFRALEGVRNRAALIRLAAVAHTEAEAICSICKGKMIVDILKQKPIELLECAGLLPLAILSDGTHVLVCPYDYVTSTRELETYVDAYRASYPNATTTLMTMGHISPAARKRVQSARIRIVEKKTFPVDQTERAREGYI